MPEFKNSALNGKYTIPGADHEIEIQEGPLAFTGRLSDIPDEARLQYLLDRNHPFIALKQTELKPAKAAEPSK